MKLCASCKDDNIERLVRQLGLVIGEGSGGLKCECHDCAEPGPAQGPNHEVNAIIDGLNHLVDVLWTGEPPDGEHLVNWLCRYAERERRGFVSDRVRAILQKARGTLPLEISLDDLSAWLLRQGPQP